MAFQEYCCFTWIIQLWAQLVSSLTITYQTPPLPDNVIFDILSRLSVKSVSICRRVCKNWLELTSESDFAHMHLQRHCSSNTEKVLLLQCILIIKEDKWPYTYQSWYDNLFILNTEAEGKRIFQKMLIDLNRSRNAFPFLMGSCNGILLFTRQVLKDSNYLLNPTTHERINVRCNGSLICGFLFHPSKKEYMLLNHVNIVGGMVDYFLFSLESESSRKVCTFPYYSRKYSTHSNGSLYWIIDYKSSNACENSVLAFNVENEVFSSFPHPDKHCGPECNRSKMRVLENDGQLLFSRIHLDYINMWVLDDDENHIWVKRYAVHLDWDLTLYPSEAHDGFEPHWPKMVVLSVDNEELLLYWKTRGLFLYNLPENKIRKIELGGTNVKEGNLGYVPSAISYVKSLVSLKVPVKFPNSGKFPTYGQVTIDLV